MEDIKIPHPEGARAARPPDSEPNLKALKGEVSL
jgi:hypothetical protein